jgi:hypothetical protein
MQCFFSGSVSDYECCLAHTHGLLCHLVMQSPSSGNAVLHGLDHCKGQRIRVRHNNGDCLDSRHSSLTIPFHSLSKASPMLRGTIDRPSQGTPLCDAFKAALLGIRTDTDRFTRRFFFGPVFDRCVKPLSQSRATLATPFRTLSLIDRHR